MRRHADGAGDDHQARASNRHLISPFLRRKDVLFRADDGKDYFGRVTKVRAGVATVVYEVDGKRVAAEVADLTRLFSAD